ncbi:MAG: DUF2585 domain-containing protein [Dongiaceae bacterium]
MTVTRLPPRVVALLGLGIVAATAAILYAMGQPPICRCGSVELWHGDVLSAENSQHLADWYSPSHLIHGLLFYALMWLTARRWTLGPRAVAALLIESAWEILENSPMVIDRYRAATISLGYSGDSVVNSVSDLGFMLLGFWLAARLPVAVSVILAILLELAVGYAIRDNLTLNIIMLLYPIDAIRTWQSGG